MSLKATLKVLKESSKVNSDLLEAHYLFEVDSAHFHFVSKNILNILERKSTPDCKTNKGKRPNGLPYYFNSLVDDLKRYLSENIHTQSNTFIQFTYITYINRHRHKQIIGSGQLTNIENRWFIRGTIKVIFEPIEYQSVFIYSLDNRGKSEILFEKKYQPSISSILSMREKQILNLISQNLSSKEIATKLYLSLNTIHTHRRNIVKKTGLNSCQQVLEKYKDIHSLI